MRAAGGVASGDEMIHYRITSIIGDFGRDQYALWPFSTPVAGDIDPQPPADGLYLLRVGDWTGSGGRDIGQWQFTRPDPQERPWVFEVQVQGQHQSNMLTNGIYELVAVEE